MMASYSQEAPVMKKQLLMAMVTFAVLLTAGTTLFFYGTPQAPEVTAAAVAPGLAPASAAEAPMSAAPRAPLAIEIPGCVCHSDDPQVVSEHAAYRMNECAGCHAGETPTRSP
jgi:hypothetical protein